MNWLVSSVSVVALTFALAPSGWAQEAGPRVSQSAGPPASAPKDTTREPMPSERAPIPVFEAVTLEAVQFENRAYFKETTIKTFVNHPVPAPLDRATLQEDALRIQAKYKSRGYLQATVNLRIAKGGTPLSKIGVFVIDAGERATLRAVHVAGNRNVSEKDLLEGLFSRPPEPLGLLTRAGTYHKPFVDRDQQVLLTNYYKRGYLSARVVQTRLVAGRDQDSVELFFDVDEGPLYEIAAVDILGDIPEGETAESVRESLSLQDDAVADLITLDQEMDTVLNRFRDEGYAFAQFQRGAQVLPPRPEAPGRQRVSFSYQIQKGPLATVRAIKLTGNNNTFDHVILRDVELEPGDTYSRTLVEQSQRNLQGLGYFAQVQVRPVPTDEPGKVDIEVVVQEQPTILPSFLPALTNNEGLVLIGLLAERNLFGTGLVASATGQFSFNFTEGANGGCFFVDTLQCQRQLFDLSLTEPRLLNTRISLSGEVHRRELFYYDYSIRSEIGGSVRMNAPIAPRNWGLFLAGGITSEFGGVIFNGEIFEDRDLFPVNVIRNEVSATLSWDKRDSILNPRNGLFLSARASYMGPFTFSGVSALTTEGTAKFFWTPLFNVTFKSQTLGAYVLNPHGGAVPVTDRFFLGGFGTLRGYAPRSISAVQDVKTVVGAGPQCSAQESGAACPVSVGGVMRLVQNTEIEFPLWPDTPFRGFLFLDAGNVFGEGEFPFVGTIANRGTQLPFNLFASVGFGVLLQTPVFPLRFEWSIPVTKREFDRPLDFFFGLGSSF